jgi:hypothetical protein
MSEDRRITDPFKDDLHALVQRVSDMSQTLSRIEEKLLKVEDHHRTLYGINGQPGLTIVVDRLDQVEKSRSQHLTVIYTAIAGLVLKAFWGVISGTKP